MTTENETIRQQAEAILASGVLGRSRFYSALFKYLLECSERNHAPKEVEIAAEVFNRGSEFDPSQDSLVRVYAHNLRQKLQQYYAEKGNDQPVQVTLPKGEYRLALASADPEEPVVAAPTVRPARSSRDVWVPLLVAAALVTGFALGRLLQPVSNPTLNALADVADSALWHAVTDDDMPVVFVIGDYYIFGEIDEIGNVNRLVREFEINSSRDLDELFMLQPLAADRYIDLELTYVPSSVPIAVRDLTEVLLAAGKDIRVVSMSAFDTRNVRDSHIVYVGYLSALGRLADFAFSGSGLEIGETYDELIDTASGQRYVSEAGLPSRRQSYRDYGMFSTMPGPGGNELVFVTGMRDEGLMQTAQAISDPAWVRDSLAAVADEAGKMPPAFELIYEVAGLDRTNLDAMIVHAAPLDESRVALRQLLSD